MRKGQCCTAPKVGGHSYITLRRPAGSTRALLPDDGSQWMRKARRLIHVILTAVGTALILYAVVALQGTYDRILFAALGLVLLEAGVWRLTRSFLPNER